MYLIKPDLYFLQSLHLHTTDLQASCQSSTCLTYHLLFKGSDLWQTSTCHFTPSAILLLSLQTLYSYGHVYLLPASETLLPGWLELDFYSIPFLSSTTVSPTAILEVNSGRRFLPVSPRAVSKIGEQNLSGSLFLDSSFHRNVNTARNVPSLGFIH